jgi:hypothetical protein
MNKTVIEAELPSELAAQAHAFVAEGWATDLNELFHEVSLTEIFIREDIDWGLHGRD